MSPTDPPPSSLLFVSVCFHSPFKDIQTAELDVAPLSRAGYFPTAVLCHPCMRSDANARPGQDDVFFAGNSDGSVVSIKVMTGEHVKTFTTPETESLDDAGAGASASGSDGGAGRRSSKSSSSRSNEVVSMAVLTCQARPVLAVAHMNGDLHTFDATTAQWLAHLRVAPNVTRIVPANPFNSLLVSHDDSNALVLWDLDADQTLKLDFTQELNAVGKLKSKMTVVDFDDARSVIFAGASDGAVFVRRLERNAAGAFGVKLMRYCNPSRNATTPSRLTAMWYDPELDRMHTGDMSGLTRLVKKVSGVPFEGTKQGADAVREGRFRTRSGSFSALSPGYGEAMAAAVAGAGVGAGAGAGAGSSARSAPRVGGGTGGGGGGADATALPTQFTLEWAHGTVAVSELGGMVVPKFVVPGGKQVCPLFVAPWARDADAQRLPPILRALRGEYACVPFGAARPVVGLTPEWASCKHEESEGPHSGHGANTTWTLESRDATSMVVSCEYPGHDAVKVVRKRVTVHDKSVTVRTEVQCRAAASLPVGMSVMFGLSPRVGSTTLVPGEFEFGSVFPGAVEPSGHPSFTLSPGASFDSLREVPRRVPPGAAVAGDGADTPQDLSELPLPDATVEAMVQLCGTNGEFHVVRHDLGCTFSLAWDPSVLPSTLLHISNNGRKYYPWSGAHTSVTVSPVASAFDLGTAVSTADNPLKSRGVDTAVDVDAGTSLFMEYTLSVSQGAVPPTAVVRGVPPSGDDDGDDGDDGDDEEDEML